MLESCCNKASTLLEFWNDYILQYVQATRCIYGTLLKTLCGDSLKENSPITKVAVNTTHTVTCGEYRNLVRILSGSHAAVMCVRCSAQVKMTLVVHRIFQGPY